MARKIVSVALTQILSQYLLLWQAVPPTIATTYFEQRYNNQPHILQYAHRVLEEHPVELTFFFIPQVVQALRYDSLGEFHWAKWSAKTHEYTGYVSRFIFETAKISQLFCHQIIWNMKANCFKDDAAEIVSLSFLYSSCYLSQFLRKIPWNILWTLWRIK